MATAQKPPKSTQTTLAKAVEPQGPRASAVSTANKPLVFTKITGTVPTRLTKIIGLNPDGTIRKQTAANLSEGTAIRVEVRGLAELRDHLDGLTSANAVSWGVTKDTQVNLCTQADTEVLAQGAIARTRKNFAFSHEPGIMMFDHDGLPDGSLTLEQFRQRLLAAVPCLAEAPMLCRPSASSGCLRPDGEILTRSDRHRIYVPVKDASLIRDAGQAIADLLWAKPGDGWVVVGVAGQALMRCLVDTAVWQPERLDFAGPPVLEDGVNRARVAGEIIGQDNGLFDLRVLIDSVTPEVRTAAESARKAARSASKAQRDEQAKAWAAERAPALAQARGISVAKAVSVLERASLRCVLMGDFELTCADGQVTTVAQLLDNPRRWHGKRFADPLDPNVSAPIEI